MFIKLHNASTKLPMYLNTDFVELVIPTEAYTRVFTENAPLGYDVIEPIDEIMKIIGYFEVRT